MNPILRAAANGLNRSRSEGQIRLEKKRALQKQKQRQEKEKKRLEALEREKKWTEHGRRQSREDGPSNEESAAEKFQKELCWCIQQLELGMANMKPNPKQAQEAERVLRILKSHKAPLAKKRQVMRATFGDYRAKMLVEEKKHAASVVKKTGVTSATSEKLSQATFFRKSAHQRSQTAPVYVPSLSPMKEEVTINEVTEGQSVISSNDDKHAVMEDEGVGEGCDQEMEVSMSEINLNQDLEDVTQEQSVDTVVETPSPSISIENKLIEQIRGEKRGLKKHDSGISSYASLDSARSLDDLSLKQDFNSEKDLSIIGKISPTHSMISSSRSSDSIYPLTSSSSSRESLLVKSQSCNTFKFNFDIQDTDKDVDVENSVCEAKKDFKRKKGKKSGNSKHLTRDESSSCDMLPEKETEDTNVLIEKKENITSEKENSSGEKTPTIEEISSSMEGKGKKKNRKKKKKKQEAIADLDESKNVAIQETNVGKDDDKKPEKGQIELSLGGGGFKFNFEDIEEK